MIHVKKTEAIPTSDDIQKGRIHDDSWSNVHGRISHTKEKKVCVTPSGKKFSSYMNNNNNNAGNGGLAEPNSGCQSHKVRTRANSDNIRMNLKYGVMTSARYMDLCMSNKRIRPILLDSVQDDKI